MPTKAPDFSAIFAVLAEHEVDFILVGALSAVLQGARLTTWDVDIVHRRDPANVERLVVALRELHAYYWEHTTKRLEPEGRTLLLPGHHLLQTDYGNLDVLGTIAPKKSYEDLIPNTVELLINPNLKISALNLETLIECKREAGRDKDKAVLPQLINTLEAIRRGRQE